MDENFTQKLKNLLKDLPTIRTGTPNSGDATTDNIISDMRDFLNKLKSNIAGQ